MAQKEIKTSILINAAPEKVWSIITDFKAYEKWNPFIAYIKGDVRVGNRIKVNAGGMKFTPSVLAFEENKAIRWLGCLLFKGLFDGEHSLTIVDNHDGTSTFKHKEKFNGLLVGLFQHKLETDTKNGFIAMNKKLKEVVESNL